MINLDETESGNSYYGLFYMVSAVILMIMVTISILILIFTSTGTSYSGEDLVFAMYDFDPNEMISQNERLEDMLDEKIAHQYLLSNDVRQLSVYLRFEMNRAEPIIVSSKGDTIQFRIKSLTFDEKRLFQIEYTQKNGKITSIKEFELFPIPPTGYWDVD